MGWSHQLEHLSCLFKLDMRCLGFFPIKLFHNLGDIGRHASARPQPTLTHHFLYISIRESAPKEPEAFNALSWSNFLWWRALVDKKIGKQLLKGDAEFSARKHWRVGSCKFLRVNLATFFFWFICINTPPSITLFLISAHQVIAWKKEGVVTRVFSFVSKGLHFNHDDKNRDRWLRPDEYLGMILPWWC